MPANGSLYHRIGVIAVNKRNSSWEDKINVETQIYTTPCDDKC